MRPIIAIGAYPRTVETAFGPTLLHTASRHYVEAVERAGGVPVILPVSGAVDVEDLLGAVHGLMFTGGGDVDPARYGEEAYDTKGVNVERDAFEARLVEQAIAADLPVLAICRGMQLLNVALGGTLVQDVAGATGRPHDQYLKAEELVHGVRVEPGSRLAEALGVVELDVNSIHHQGVARVAPDLQAVAWADDGSVEGVELPGARFTVGVQWHPEMLEDWPEQQGVFRGLVEEARRSLARR